MKPSLTARLLTALLCAVLALFSWAGTGQTQGNGTPADFQKWQVDDTTFRTRIGGQLANYPDVDGGDTSWAAIANDWSVVADSAVNLTDIIKTTVKLNGQSVVKVTWNGVEYTATQKPAKLVWINTNNWDWQDITGAPTWGTPTVDSNIISWENVWPGVNYKIQKTNATVAHAIIFKPAFLDSAVTLFDAAGEPEVAALANVMTYTLSATCDDADSAIGTVNKRRLKQLGKYSFELSEQTVQFPGSDTMPTLYVKQRWERRDNVIVCAEYITMSRVKQIHEAYPTAVIWHNDVTTISNTTGDIEDTYLKSDAPNHAYGGGTFVYLDAMIVRVKNVALNLGEGATITACTLSAYCATFYSNKVVPIYRVFKPWVEGNDNGIDNDDGDATWNDWASDASEWGSSGCASASDAGSDNSGDKSGSDRKATAEDNLTINATGWWEWDITTGLAQAWYDGTANENGVVMGPSAITYSVKMGVTEGSNPAYYTFTYTVGGAANKNQRRRKILIGGQ